MNPAPAFSDFLHCEVAEAVPLLAEPFHVPLYGGYVFGLLPRSEGQGQEPDAGGSPLYLAHGPCVPSARPVNATRGAFPASHLPFLPFNKPNSGF